MATDAFLIPYEAALAGRPLSSEAAEQAFDAIMSGMVDHLQIAAFLAALKVRGETADELYGAARVLRVKAKMVTAPAGAVDTAGTGGDFSHTHNVSTAAAIVAAACGVPVAKHGNKAMSSRSGSADVLKALGVNTDMTPAKAEACMRDVGIAFLMATHYHLATAQVAPVRRAMAVRTIFNLLGPLTNPAGAKHQLIGVYDPLWLEPMALVAGRLGATRAWVVHGADNLDEISTTGPTEVAEWRAGEVRRFTIDARDFGVTRATLAHLRGGEAKDNAAAIRRMLEGAPGPLRDITLVNAAATLVVADAVSDLQAGLAKASTAIDSGAAARLLTRWANYGKEKE
ncbi:MAG: anthranilate phosphoribosyltransferase [Pseudomonadota bacterium]